jgi:gamma-glutamyltranspeptidase/glutathione hydrolase
MAAFTQANRPYIMGTSHMTATGHPLSAQAALAMLEAGGNAIDAGVAAGLATAILEPTHVSLAGVAPIILYHAESQRIVTISGLGTWPKAASLAYFVERHQSRIPLGVERSVVPAAPDAWITALEHFGTMSFAQVAEPAIRLARDGFPVYPRMAKFHRETQAEYRRWPSNAGIYLPDGRPPETGEMFYQRDAAGMLQHMADEETRGKQGGRVPGLQAARDAFYRGDIAATIARFYQENGGLLTREDLAGFRVGIEPPVTIQTRGIDLYGCGPWTQGPMLLQALSILDGIDLAALGHNSAAYVHALVEAIKLAAADRDAYYGDPRLVDVPMQALLSKAYGAARRALIDPDRAIPGLATAGEVPAGTPPWRGAPLLTPAEGHLQSAFDTSYVCAVDRFGNAFSATPSDPNFTGPVVPGTGSVISTRGDSSWTDPTHPACVAPGKRPRLTCNPALAVRDGRFFMPFGTPGGDVQTQAMLQVFLNLFAFDLDPQSAVEAPRFASYSFASSFEPHETLPDRLDLEPAIGADVGASLSARGHQVAFWSGPVNLAGSVCLASNDTATGLKLAAADFRRTSYAIGR